MKLEPCFALVVLLMCGSAHAQTYSKTETIKYYDDTNLWVLGQIERTTTNGIETSRNDYWPATASLQRTWAFGKQQQYLVYDPADGTLASITDGKNHTTRLSNWKRGIPQTIQHPATPESPAGAIQSAVVNDQGWITSATDENGYTTSYDHDEMGRTKLIVYPASDSTAWHNTTISFNRLTDAAYGLPAGHWRQTIQTGNARSLTFFDALWQPVVKEVYDAANLNNTLTQTVIRYDPDGRPAFASYPQRTLNAAVYNTWADPAQTPNALGVRTFYDALDRVTKVDQDSELGVLRTTTEYLPGFQTRVTNPRQQVTTTGYVAYDQPSTDQVAWISHPLGAYTAIFRDVFGKPIHLVRHTAGNTEWSGRYYIYDAHQRLCKRTELETGTTNMGYDDAGNLAWSASGLPWSTDNNCAMDTTGRRIDRTYDTRNRIKTLRFPDGNGNQDWSYAPDGLPSQVSTWNVPAPGVQPTLANNSYQYNKRRLLTGETVNQPGWYSFSLGYGYDGNANLASHNYPSGLSVTYSPNALGQATQVVGTAGGVSTNYAIGVNYYPNNAISGFTYGNGMAHTMLPNARQLPEWVVDQGALHFRYSYDANGNVGAITDFAQGRHREMTYDDLDRLQTAASPLFGGTLTYGYDKLDNITSVVGPDRNHRYCYSGGHHLLFVRSNSSHCEDGAAVTALTYDNQGNVASKNQVGYRFDFGNRLREASSTETKERYRYDAHGRRVLASRILGPADTLGIIFSQYATSGQLMYQENHRSAVAKKIDQIYLGNSLIVQREVPVAGGAATLKYQHTDALGSPVAVTNANATEILERMEYEPYGKGLFGGPGTTAPKDGLGYTGHVLDVATGMNYMQQRYYDPGIGRFLSVDPVTANSSTGANFNRYWYANNNPYRFTDPDGRQSVQELIDQGATGCGAVSCAGWAALSATWQVFGAEGVSQIADKGMSAGAGNGAMAVLEVATLGKGKILGEASQTLWRASRFDAFKPEHMFSADHVRQGIMDLGRNMDAIVGGARDAIMAADKTGALKNGDNTIITTMNGHVATVRAFFKNGELQHMNVFKDTSEREAKNVIDLREATEAAE